MKRVWIGFMLGFAMTGAAELQLNTIFKDNMVLQRDVPISIYGTAVPGKKVYISFNGQRKIAKPNKSGGWEIKLDPTPKSFEPGNLIVSQEKTKIIIRNVLVGDVWLCGGQSNMAHPFRTYPLLKDQVKDIHEPDIRCLVVEKRSVGDPKEDLILSKPFADTWHEAREPWLSPVSPTAYFFAAKLRRDLDVPIGLIISAVGGTQIQRWVPRDVIEKMNLDSESSAGAGVLYNGMIHPLRDFSIKGVIWYQGESNGRIPYSYYDLSRRHIESWRAVWTENNPYLKEMPFFTVQLAPFMHTVDGLASDAWAYIRDAQLKTLDLPNTGLAVTTDVGEFADIHPQDKQPVGERLARWAEKLENGEVQASGPLFDKAIVDGANIVVFFNEVGSGLETRRVVMSSQRNVWAEDDPNAYVVEADSLTGFMICGADKKFVPAQAEIVEDHVRVFSDKVPSPVAVRYGWSTFALCNLYNKEGLPASPFRSDDFQIPDVQGRVIGKAWDKNETAAGSKMKFTGTNGETKWMSIEKDRLTGYRPESGKPETPRYAYFKVTNPAFQSGKGAACVLRITYFDDSDGTLTVQYDSSDKLIKTVPDQPGAWKNAGKVKLKKSGKWCVAELSINDAQFDGRCNGADIRISCTGEAVLGGVYCSKK